jgi:hypothetical protein
MTTATHPSPAWRPGLFRHAGWFFLLLLPFIAIAFWPSYLSRLPTVDSARVHVHALAMGGWYALLVSQALLIRSGQRAVHRALGKLSYAWVPFVVLTTLVLAQRRAALTLADGKPEVWRETLYFLYVQMALLALFVMSWALAIRHRREPQVHARYMVCTLLTLIDPIFARILYNVWGIDFPPAQVITYTLTDAILLGLAWRDRRGGSGHTVFARMGVPFVLLQLPTFFVYTWPGWRTLAEAMARLAPA